MRACGLSPLSDHPRRATPDSPRLAFGLLRLRPVRIALLLAVVLWLPIGTYDSLWARYLEDRGATAVFVGITLSLYGVPFAIASGWGGRLVDRIGPMPAVKRAMWIVVPMIAFYGRLVQPWAIAARWDWSKRPPTRSRSRPRGRRWREPVPPSNLLPGQGLASAASQFAAGLAAFGLHPRMPHSDRNGRSEVWRWSWP